MDFFSKTLPSSTKKLCSKEGRVLANGPSFETIEKEVRKVHVFGFRQRKYQPTSEDSVLALFVGWYFTWTFLRFASSSFSARARQGEPKARLQQKIEEADARPLAEVYERTRKRKVNDQSSPLGERWSVVNLSFSFRTPSTSSYLLVGVNEREDRRLPTVDSRTRVTVG